MSGKHLRSLDGLRGVAILLVVLYHVFPHRGVGLFGYLLSGAWCGVDLFFVLSGFLITGILFDSQGAPSFFRNFYIRRTLRLAPVYFAFIALVLLLPRQPTGYSWWLTFVFIFYGSNIVRSFLPEFQFGRPIVTGHIWSIAVEEQFYLVWPWLVVLLKTRRRIFVACIVGAVAVFFLRLATARALANNPLFLYFQLPTRADSFLLGGAAAMLYRTQTFLTLHLTRIRILGVLAAVAFLTLALRIHTFYFADPPVDTWGFSLLAFAFAALLLDAVTPGSISGRLLDNAFLRFYGRYSYGLYLIHQAPAAYDAQYVLPVFESHLHPFWLATTCHFLFVLASATVLAVLSFHFIEQPFLRLKTHFPLRPGRLPSPQPSSQSLLNRVS